MKLNQAEAFKIVYAAALPNLKTRRQVAAGKVISAKIAALERKAARRRPAEGIHPAPNVILGWSEKRAKEDPTRN